MFYIVQICIKILPENHKNEHFNYNLMTVSYYSYIDDILTRRNNYKIAISFPVTKI